MTHRKLTRSAIAILMTLAFTLPVTGPVAADHDSVAGQITVSPSTGPEEGKNKVTITHVGGGTKFKPVDVTAVLFCKNGIAATNCETATVKSLSDTSIVVEAAKKAAAIAFEELIDVRIEGGTNSPHVCVDCFRYQELALDSISPGSGPGVGGTAVTFRGKGFRSDKDQTTATFGGVEATGLKVNDAGTVATATTPPGSGLVAACISDVDASIDGAIDSSCLSFTYTGPAPGPGGNVTGIVATTEDEDDISGFPEPGPLGDVDVVAVNVNTLEVVATQTSSTGRYSLRLGAGRWRISVADRKNEQKVGDPGCDEDSPCGHKIATRLIDVVANVDQSQSFNLTHKRTPVDIPDDTTVIFGEAMDALTGLPLQGAQVRAIDVDNGTVASTATVDGTGRFELNAGLSLTRAYRVELRAAGGAALQCIQIKSGENTCVDEVVTSSSERGIDPNFLAFVAATRRLEAVVPFVANSPDTSRTGGINIDTTAVRVVNAGPKRTTVEIDFHASDVDGRHTGTDTETFDLNPGAAASFTGNLIPSGMLGMAEIFSRIPANLPEGADVGLSDIQATTKYEITEAGGAVAGTNALTTEDILGGATPAEAARANQNQVLPLLYKNHGGGAHKWESLVSACLGKENNLSRQPVVFFFTGSAGDYTQTWSAEPGGCVFFNMRDLPIPDGSWAARVNSTGSLANPTTGFPNAFLAASVSLTRTGKQATASQGYTPITGESPTGGRQLHAALVFKRYNNWNTGIQLANFPITGTSGSVSYSAAFYDESGRLVGIVSDRISGERIQVLYTPRLPIDLPDGFRGAVVIDSEATSGAGRPFAVGQHVNYERNHAISYNLMRGDALGGTDAPFVRPCTAVGFDACYWSPEVVKIVDGRGNPSGENTGVRIFNPSGNAVTVLTRYFDAAGIEWDDARQSVTIPPFGTATLFTASNRELPSAWSGSVYIQARGGSLVVLGNIVDYGVTGRDGSRAFNIPSNRGLTQ